MNMKNTFFVSTENINIFVKYQCILSIYVCLINETIN